MTFTSIVVQGSSINNKVLSGTCSGANSLLSSNQSEIGLQSGFVYTKFKLNEPKRKTLAERHLELKMLTKYTGFYPLVRSNEEEGE